MYHLIKQFFKKERKPDNACYVVAIATNVQQDDLAISMETFPFATKTHKQDAVQNNCDKVLYREIFIDKAHALAYKKQLLEMSLEELVSYLEYHHVDWDNHS